MDRRITVEPHGGPGRLLGTIEGRRTRAFALSADEAAVLHALLGRHLPPVIVTGAPEGGPR